VKNAQKLFVGLLVALLAFLGVSSFAIWEDGRRFAFVQKQRQPAPDGVAAASYLDTSRFRWKTTDKLHQYARKHHLELAGGIEENGAP
jgi:hypothetical protein